MKKSLFLLIALVFSFGVMAPSFAEEAATTTTTTTEAATVTATDTSAATVVTPTQEVINEKTAACAKLEAKKDKKDCFKVRNEMKHKFQYQKKLLKQKARLEYEQKKLEKRLEEVKLKLEKLKAEIAAQK